MSTAPGFSASVAWRDWPWFGSAVLVHLLFLAAVMRANGWSVEPVMEVHDGVYYASHLTDPLLTNIPDWWDNVPYRAIRLGYVLLAFPFKALGEPQALVIAGLIGVGAGALAVRAIARRHGASELVAWSMWVFNPGALVATALILPDSIAWTAILLALLAIDDRRWVLATVLSVFAVLTKEASLAALGLAAVMAWRSGDKRALAPVVVAAIVHAGVLSILVSRFGGSSHSGFLTLPLLGWAGALPEWLSIRPVSGAVGVFVFATGLLLIVQWWRTRSLYLAAAAGQAILMVFLASSVLAPLSNTSRIGGLFWPLLAATRRQADEESADRARLPVAPTLKGDVRAAQDV